MKCAYYQKQKQNRMTTENKKRLQKVVDNFMQKAISTGPDKALEMMREESEHSKEGIV